MPVLVLQKIDSDNCSTFDLGEHTIGRGPKLRCTLQTVSRNHGLLKVSNNGIFLKSMHNNPCFYKKSLLTNISLLTYGNTVQLYNDDKIALSLEHGWFRIQIEDSQNGTKNENKDLSTNESKALENVSVKREIENDNEEVIVKKSKLEESTNIEKETLNVDNIVIKNEPPDNHSDAACSSIANNDTSVKIKEESLEENISEIKSEPSNNDDSTEDIEKEMKTEDDNDCKKNSKTDSPSTSGTNTTWRDRCWYGRSCYRKNPAHRAKVCHFGDTDYDSDPNDSRPICCYGVNCYRKNKLHRRRFRHPGQDKIGTKSPGTKMRKAKTKKRSPPPSIDLEDSYDYSDPFLNDDSSDDYEPAGSTSETESEYEDDDDAEDNKRMLREAKKFTRN